MITVTDSAASKIKELIAREGKPILRIKVLGGGCSGLTTQMLLVSEPDKNDQEFEVNGVKLVVDKRSLIYLTGATINYLEGLNESGFKLQVAGISNSCGCGKSFSV